MSEQEFVDIMKHSIDTNKYICDSYQSSLKLYKKTITLIVVGFVICIFITSASFVYTNYLSYDYDGYPDAPAINNTNTSISGEDNTNTQKED